MLKTNNLKQKGFTIVELLIVIVVIAILAALVLNTFAGVQEKARDSDRQNDLATVQKHLETYYTDHGHYPSATQLADANWRHTNMEGLSDDAFVAPQDSDGNSLQSTASTAKDQYGYVATCTVQGTVTDNDADCTKYALSWWSEAKDQVNTIDSLSGQ